jgi:hypothetical protein
MLQAACSAMVAAAPITVSSLVGRTDIGGLDVGS